MMRSFSLGWVAVFSILFGESSVAAPVKSLDFTIHEEYTSTRALGMGNAFTAVADDHSAIFYNPAALANRTDGQVRMFLRGGTDASALKLRKQLDDIKKQPKETQTQSYSDMIASHYGDHFYLRAPTVGAVWVRPGWGLAFIPVDMSFDADVHRQIGPMINVNLYVDSTLAVGYAKKVDWFGNRHDLSWGATAKAVHRIYGGQAVSAGALADGTNVFSTSNGNEGLTGDVDLGSYWTPPVPSTGFFSFFNYARPHFALVGRNLVDYGFKTNFHFVAKDSGEPPKLGRRFDFGSKFDLPKWWVFDPHLSADMRDIGHENWSPRKGSHVGMELYWKMYNWWK
ncbi:MAG: hypothetical protein ACXVA9_13790, partial [Bdellovibrionales bacterium]